MSGSLLNKAAKANFNSDKSDIVTKESWAIPIVFFLKLSLILFYKKLLNHWATQQQIKTEQVSQL